MNVTDSNFHVSVLSSPEETESAKSLLVRVFGYPDYMSRLFGLQIRKTVFGVFSDSELCACTLLFTSDRVGYVYAMCVSPEHRGKGMFKLLCSHITEYGKARYDRIFLVPATERLFSSYRSMGFEKVLYRKLYDTAHLKIINTEYSREFYSSYAENVDFAAEYELLKLHFEFSADRPVSIFKFGVLIGFGVVSANGKLISAYPFSGQNIEYTGKEKTALSIDYTPNLEMFTDGVYID